MTEEWRWIGSDHPKVLVAGHSHRVALILALKEGLDGGIGAVLSGTTAKQGTSPNTAYWLEVARQDPAIPIALPFLGQSHNHAFLFDGGVPFTFVHPLLEPLDASCTVVPIEAIRERINTVNGADAVHAMNWVCEKLAGHRCVLIATPPPKSDEYIRRGLASESYFMDLLSAGGWTVEDAPVTPLVLRRALRAVMFDALAEVAAKHGVPFIDVPPDAVDRDGSLKPDYSAPDATHANAAYGALVWRQLADHFRLDAAAPSAR